MLLSKKLCRVKANSLLESVIALSIISICLYIAIMVYAAVFSPKTSLRFYSERNKVNEAFFLLQIQQDSLMENYTNGQWEFEDEMTSKIKKVTVKYRDSITAYPEKSFYINAKQGE
ncbi:hypothetical protein AAEO56_11665 [Flavobacterium sp. DGU11]|uniref:Type II secretion system protein n=1 Tax=Flavobacterium arundinis TaxID=3139143 RepID=A0ABU9HXM5_9FLAO